MDAQNPALIAETELFQRMKLAPGQPIETYASLVLEKGAMLQKQQGEMLSRFEDGLPDMLAFFVRAAQPQDVQAALIQAKRGEAHGYRVHPPIVTAAAAGAKMAIPFAPPPTQQTTEVQELKNELRQLTKTVEGLAMAVQSGPQPRNDSTTWRPQNGGNRGRGGQNSQSDVQCYQCNSYGHVKRACNWIADGNPRPDLKCQLCFQSGHGAQKCRTRDAQMTANKTGSSAGPNQQEN
jgi:hypothetical protein